MPEVLENTLRTAFIVAQIVIGLGFLIFIHEAGHFLVAKWKGVRVDAFSLGMGPILWKRVWKGTEYRVSAIPLGGYVKMAGENIGDPKTGAPDELTSKPAFARLQIFAAGALMNLFIAFPLAILACLAGRSEGSPVIGSPSYADTLAHLQPGDRLVSAGGKKLESTDEYRKFMVASPQGKQVDVVVNRAGKEQTFSVTVMESKRHFTLPPPTTLPKIIRGTPAYQAGLRDFAEVLEVNGQEPRFDYGEFQDQLAKAANEGPITLRVRNPGEEPSTVVLKDLPRHPKEEWIPQDYRLIEPVIAQPRPGSPAALAGLQAGDYIQKIGSKDIETFQDLYNEVISHPAEEVTIKYKRGGVEETTKARIVYRSQGRGKLGVEPGNSPRLVQVAEGTVFHKADLRSGDVLLKIGELSNAASVHIAGKGRLGPVKLEIRRGEETLTRELRGEMRQTLNFEGSGFLTEQGTLVVDFNRIDRRWGFGDAVSKGLQEPIEVIDITFRILGKLFVREEDPSGLAGPVGIFKASFFHAKAGLGNFLWLLVLITVNLGIFNLLPVPVLDGGHILLLVIEKVKGGPPTPRFVERFQLVGLILLLSLLIFVTFNDLR
ncbi:MAG TPA: site-2 protease family protein [Planctomycetota bacterium]|nr:site-2 protease family protein [Planctomycetota bacterium]